MKVSKHSRHSKRGSNFGLAINAPAKYAANFCIKYIYIYRYIYINIYVYVYVYAYVYVYVYVYISFCL